MLNIEGHEAVTPQTAPLQTKPIDLQHMACASADFFPGRQEPTFCLKNNKKDTIFPPKKSKNILFLAGQGEQEPPLPSPADAHDLQSIFN